MYEEKLSAMINRKIRQEKIAIKDVKLRTFITEDISRNEMGAACLRHYLRHCKKGEDTLVVIDDSIVRGTNFEDEYCKNAITT